MGTVIPLTQCSRERSGYEERGTCFPLTALWQVPAHVSNVAHVQGCSLKSHKMTKAGPNLHVHQQVKEVSGQKHTMGYQAANLSAKQGKSLTHTLLAKHNTTRPNQTTPHCWARNKSVNFKRVKPYRVCSLTVMELN